MRVFNLKQSPRLDTVAEGKLQGAEPKGSAPLLFSSPVSIPHQSPPEAFTQAERAASPSLSLSHNSDALSPAPEANGQQSLPFRLTGSQAKTAFALRHNAEKMIAEAGIESVGFLTLTVGDFAIPQRRVCGTIVQEASGPFRQVWDAAEASRRINNLSRRLLRDVFERSIVVTERHKSGAIHFHLLGIVRGRPDIRTGFDFMAVLGDKKRGVAGGDYSSVCQELLALWAMMRERLPGYGFGRAELTPVRSNAEAVSCYCSKYVEKNLFNRLPEDKGKKLVRYLGFEGAQLRPNDFGWASKRAVAWRGKAEQLATLAGVRSGEAGREEVADAFGPRWAFHLTRVMRDIDDAPLPAFVWASPFERECARQLVLRVARTRWTIRRAKENARSPVEWRPDWERIHESRRERFEPSFGMFSREKNWATSS